MEMETIVQPTEDFTPSSPHYPPPPPPAAASPDEIPYITPPGSLLTLAAQLDRLHLHRHPISFGYNLPRAQVHHDEVARGEGRLASNGAFAVHTSADSVPPPPAHNVYIVRRNPSSERVAWGRGTHGAVSGDGFGVVWKEVARYLEEVCGMLYAFDGYVGARRRYARKVRVVTELAWQHEFCSNMFVGVERVDGRGGRWVLSESWVPDVTVLVAPGYFNPDLERMGISSEAFTVVDYERGLVVVAGTRCSGAIRKALFTYMDFLLPLSGVLPLHCSATRSKTDPNDVVLLLGLSGTGKTTLSADPTRLLIGDDQHAWDDQGVFSLEGGCYPRVLNLESPSGADIYDAIRENAILENVVCDNSGGLDFADKSRVEIARCSYPLEHIPDHEPMRKGAHPHSMVFLTCDVFGVLPPVSRLTPEQAIYFFISGYSSAMTEAHRGVTEPVPTFSSCFGAEFMPMGFEVYAELLREKIRRHNTTVYLVNTGWAGGSYGTGNRMSIETSRSIIVSIADGSLRNAEYNPPDPVFGLHTPNYVRGVEGVLLQPRKCWSSEWLYDSTAKRLASMFRANWKLREHPAHLANVV